MEELFLPDASVAKIEDMTVLGIVSRVHDRKAQLCLLAHVRMSSKEVMRVYKAANEDCEESVQLLFWPAARLSELLEAGDMSGRRIMPEHHGAIELACAYYDWRRGHSASTKADVAQSSTASIE